MDINSVGYGSALTPEVQAQYAVKLTQMIQDTEKIAGSIILDTVEVSQEAMEKFMSEQAQ